eukprot:scaffold52421_cov57-Phaeocystis_antarctica.AAC.3
MHRLRRACGRRGQLDPARRAAGSQHTSTYPSASVSALVVRLAVAVTPSYERPGEDAETAAPTEVMVVKLTVTKAGDEDGPSATLRVEFVIGDGAFSLGTDAPCRVLFPPSQGVERCHCSLSLRSPSAATRGAEHSEWELTPRDGTVRVPTLASTDDGGFCQVLALQST